MAEIDYWEKKFVETYIIPAKVDRYLLKLKNPKHRQDILERLNHTLDFRPELAEVVGQQFQSPFGFLALLESQGVQSNCRVIADTSNLDGTYLGLKDAIFDLFCHGFGYVIICPPLPIALYAEESIGKTYLFRPPHPH